MIPTTKSFRYAAKFIVDVICRRDDDDAPETVVYDFSVSHVISLLTLIADLDHTHRLGSATTH